MARPKKNNAEYFTHDADMRNDVKIKALRRKFSHRGFAVWCFLLETLTDNDFFEIEWEEINIELLAADYEVSDTELKEIVEYCIKIDLLQQEGDKIYSEAHQRRFAALLSNRARKRGNDKETPSETTPTEDNGEVSASHNPGETPPDAPNGEAKTHSKVKESKVKYSKEKEIINISLSNALASETEKETFFEIFFFKNFKDPAGEVERFCSNYESTGWIRSNGQPVIDRVALSKTWSQKDEKAAPRFPAKFLDAWKILYRDAKQKQPTAAQLLISELEGVSFDENKIELICHTKVLPEFIEGNIDYFGRFFKKFFPDKKLKYTIPNQ